MYDTIKNIVLVLVMLVLVSVIAIIIFLIVRGLSTRRKNNHAPRLIVPAMVVGKRQDIVGNRNVSGVCTNYYVTFQLEGGDRQELLVPDSEYGMIVKGDEGKLTFQGTRYLSFERK